MPRTMEDIGGITNNDETHENSSPCGACALSVSGDMTQEKQKVQEVLCQRTSHWHLCVVYLKVMEHQLCFN